MRASSIGAIAPGAEIVGSTGGSVDLIEILEHCAAQLEAPEVTVVTWTASPPHLARLRALAAAPRLVVDATYPGTHADYCREAVRLFGTASIRLTRTHAKFALVRGSGMHLVVRSSMNLNQNKRTELFAISDDRGLFARLDDLVSDLFSEHDGAEQLAEFRRLHNASFRSGRPDRGGLITRRGRLGDA